jgi:hypothetical protein
MAGDGQDSPNEIVKIIISKQSFYHFVNYFIYRRNFIPISVMLHSFKDESKSVAQYVFILMSINVFRRQRGNQFLCRLNVTSELQALDCSAFFYQNLFPLCHVFRDIDFALLKTYQFLGLFRVPKAN